ncbi:hypothetical protein BS47DRAFT_1336265 [Hydnum rufescens UP504]|uniref:Cyclin-dependent kinases regulatory subunit n=1 Tax=Hydnum rufescens UP504 TaxID=1448309 RepID=A0A9P6B9K7_9AGAM|nr:hypothetical protein BS47DRAFT_1336265 [Hydnum rufescens UP504]
MDNQKERVQEKAQTQKDKIQKAKSQKEKELELEKKWKEYVDNIIYSNRYSDDVYEYRHVILPKQFLKLIPKQLFEPNDSGSLRILAEEEWRGIGIIQSIGWEHYEVHAPEPHVLLFRRLKESADKANSRTK